MKLLFKLLINVLLGIMIVEMVLHRIADATLTGILVLLVDRASCWIGNDTNN